MHTELSDGPIRLVQLDLPPEIIREIDRSADAETISRATWMRRLLFIRQDEMEQWAEAIRAEEAAA